MQSLTISSVNKTPKVSIGMPVYNGEQFIKSALDSLLAQTFIDFELIISDNSSKDKTEEVCGEFSKKDSRVKYFRQPNNIGAARNFEFVLKAANGQYFMWAACDDRWDITFVEKTLKKLHDTPEAIGAISKVIFSNKSISDATYTMAGDLKKRLYTFIWSPGDNSRFYALFYRDILERSIKNIDWDFYAGDWLVMSTVLEHGPIAQVPEVLMTREVVQKYKHFNALPNLTIIPLFKFSKMYLKESNYIDIKIIIGLMRLNFLHTIVYIKYLFTKFI